MKDSLLYILKSITTHPDDVNVDEQVDPSGVKHLVITTNPEDVGRVIGKEGKVIKALRTIMRVAAIIRGEKVQVTVVSEEGSAQPVAADASEATAPTETTPESEDQLQVEIE